MPSSGCQTCALDRKSTRLNSSHTIISYAVFCLKKKPRPLAVPGRRGLSNLIQGLLAVGASAYNSVHSVFFFFNDTAPPEISPLSLPDALPIWRLGRSRLSRLAGVGLGGIGFGRRRQAG